MCVPIEIRNINDSQTGISIHKELLTQYDVSEYLF